MTQRIEANRAGGLAAIAGAAGAAAIGAFAIGAFAVGALAIGAPGGPETAGRKGQFQVRKY